MQHLMLLKVEQEVQKFNKHQRNKAHTSSNDTKNNTNIILNQRL